ncbi:MAG: hypothetical protein BAJALOKI1v1_1410007 [Promethearchaeota archaeon]|nr:MAG: hypothetical protein BAJALOKI1v1_1410007 [Candidatus Lokiarchaeota archaeon]
MSNYVIFFLARITREHTLKQKWNLKKLSRKLSATNKKKNIHKRKKKEVIKLEKGKDSNDNYNQKIDVEHSPKPNMPTAKLWISLLFCDKTSCCR